MRSKHPPSCAPVYMYIQYIIFFCNIENCKITNEMVRTNNSLNFESVRELMVPSTMASGVISSVQAANLTKALRL